MKCGDVGGPWVGSQAARCEPLSFAYFSLRLQRKVGAAPHRGNTNKPKAKSGCQRKRKQQQQQQQKNRQAPRRGKTNRTHCNGAQPPTALRWPCALEVHKPRAAHQIVNGTTLASTSYQTDYPTRTVRRECDAMTRCVSSMTPCGLIISGSNAGSHSRAAKRSRANGLKPICC